MGIALASCVLMCVSIDCVLLSVVMFDPACFYGHHEYDLAIAGMFGGFTRQFYDEYHSIILKAAGFELRHKLYLLFHYLNHWYDSIDPSYQLLLSVILPRNHFGSSYRSLTISTLKELTS